MISGKTFWGALIGLLLVGALFHFWPEQDVIEKWGGRHVLVITLDTMRADHLGCAGFSVDGSSLTPNLDLLAAEGVHYQRASASSPLTLPSHATIFSGLEPPAHGIRENDGFFLPEVGKRSFETLAEVLAREGVRTGAVVSTQVLWRGHGLSSGFEDYNDIEPRGGGHHHLADRDAAETTDLAVKWIGKHQDADASLLWVHYFDPHMPYVLHGGAAGRVAEAVGRVTGDEGRGLYAGEVAFLDSHLGRLIREYRELGLWDRTLCIVVGDHGESLGEHGERTHGYLVNESTLHVPLIVKPFAGGARPMARSARTADVFPTILEAMGVDGAAVSGTSLYHPAEDTAYGETMYTFRQFNWAALRCWRHADLKMIDGGGGRRELYDLEDDPGEMRNLAVNRPDDVSRLYREMNAFLGRNENRSSVDTRVQGLRRIQGVSYLGGPAGNVPVEPDPETNSNLPHPAGQMTVVRLLDDLRLGLEQAAGGGLTEQHSGLERARQAYEQLEQQEADCPVVLYWGARARLKMGQSSVEWPGGYRIQLLVESLDLFDRYLAKRPLDWRAMNQALSVCLAAYDDTRKNRWLDDLLVRFDVQEARGLSDGLTWALRGQAMGRLQRYEEALKAFKKAVELAPRNQAFRSDLQAVRVLLERR